jgi:hypothetical protein
VITSVIPKQLFSANDVKCDLTAYFSGHQGDVTFRMNVSASVRTGFKIMLRKSVAV